MTWFNPDTFCQTLVDELGIPFDEANAKAWQEGVRRLDEAIAERRDYTFETTLGGKTITAKLRQAAESHDILIWYCGLDTPERHIARVKARVDRGGHDIPQAKIRERWNCSRANLITLLPLVAKLSVYDNSEEADSEGRIPTPALVLKWAKGKVIYPRTSKDLATTPQWAKPIVEAALTAAEG